MDLRDDYGFGKRKRSLSALRTRLGPGTHPLDVMIQPVFTVNVEASSTNTMTLNIEDLSEALGIYQGDSKWRMFTLTGIMFIQSNGDRNAENFENLTKSIGDKSGSIITRELLVILGLSVDGGLLTPGDRWGRILDSCKLGRIV